MSYDPSTYVANGPWTSYGHLSRAPTTPKIVVTLDEADESTPESYFEYRAVGKDRFVHVSVGRTAGSGGYSYAIEKSDDDGETWIPFIEEEDKPLSRNVRYSNPVKLRGRLVSVGESTEVTFSLSQHI